jgi:hypothetical protein
VVWKRGSEALKISFMVKRNPRVFTIRDISLGTDVLVVGEEEPCGCISTQKDKKKKIIFFFSLEKDFYILDYHIDNLCFRW